MSADGPAFPKVAVAGEPDTPPSLAEAIRVWVRIGCLSFGGPAAQIALMHRELVEDRRWIDENRFLNALSFCMLLPGPEAMQLATYIGWRLHGMWGGLAAGLLFVVPGAILILGLAAAYALLGERPMVDALFLGVKAAVVLIVIEALLRIGRRTLKAARNWLIAGQGFFAIFFLGLPFPAIVLAAAVAGYLMGSPAGSAPPPQIDAAVPITRSAARAAAGLILWWAPLLGLWLVDPNGILFAIGAFFSKLAVVTFGGAYAVLAYMAQDVVQLHGWISAGAMMDGLGLAETTPGPLILVTEFVGFLAAFADGGIALGVAGAAVALWVTFVPCFTWIFVGAPYVDRLLARPRLRGALDGITAAVVGVILNLTIWFALHVYFAEVTLEPYGILQLWTPTLASVDGPAIGLSAVAALLLFRLHWGLIRTLLAAAAMGGVLGAIGA